MLVEESHTETAVQDLKAKQIHTALKKNSSRQINGKQPRERNTFLFTIQTLALFCPIKAFLEAVFHCRFRGCPGWEIPARLLNPEGLFFVHSSSIRQSGQDKTDNKQHWQTLGWDQTQRSRYAFRSVEFSPHAPNKLTTQVGRILDFKQI